MDSVSQKVLVVRMRTNLALRELLGTDVLGSMTDDEEQAAPLALAIVSFNGTLQALPIVKMSLVTTMAITLLVMHLTNPVRQPAMLTSPVGASFHAAAPQDNVLMSPVGQEVVPPVVQQIDQAQSSSSSSVQVESSESSVATEQVISPAPESSSESSSASAVAEAVVVPGVPKIPGGERADNKFGVYVTANSVQRTEFLHSTIDSLLASGGNALVFDVKGGAVLFHSAAPMANKVDLVRPFYELPDILKMAHERGLYTIGRFVAIKDGGLTMKMPETRIKNPKTGKVISSDWVDPSNDTAIAYNMEVICELAQNGIDEVNLDYIRFSTAQFGALGVFSGQQKADHVEAFIQAARDTINRCGSKTKLGLSTYAILGWDYKTNVETLGQDVVRFAPLVDVISPMAYPATFAEGFYYRPGKDPRSRMYFLVYRTLKGYEDLLGQDQMYKLRPWIQGYGITRQDMSDQIDAVYDAGLCGYTVWNARNAYTAPFAAMKIQKRPARCL